MKGDRVIKNGFGRGCQTERIHSVISSTPMSVEEIARASGQAAPRVRRHCTYWVGENLFYGQTSDGRFYLLKHGPQPGNL